MNRTSDRTLKIATALAWEFFANGWFGMLLATFGALAMPSFVFAALMSTGGSEPLNDTEIGRLLQFSFYWMTILSIGSAIFAALGNPKQRYALPASSLLLVAGPMACAMVTMFAQYTIVAMVVNALFDAGWTIWGPGLLAAVLIAWCQAALWATSNSSIVRGAVFLATFIVLCFAAAGSKSPYDSTVGGYMMNFGGWHVLSIGLATLASVAVGSAGFASLRHGSGIEVDRIIDWVGQIISFQRKSRSAPFPSPTSAQFWLEWTDRGFSLPVVIALMGIAAIIVSLCMEVKDGSSFMGGMSGFSFAPLFVIGIYWGSRSPLGEFGNFNGTRPLSDVRLANAVLKSATLGLLVSMLIWATCMTVVVLILGEYTETSRLFRSLQQISHSALLARIVLVTLLAWSAVNFVTSLSLAGRKVIGVAMALAFGAWMAGVLLPLCLARESRASFTQAYILTCLVVCLIVCGATFVASLRLHLISVRTLRLTAAIVLVAVIAAHFSELSQNWKYLPFFCSCALIPIPLAAAPLAVYWNRHR